MSLPKAEPREHWALRYTYDAGGRVRISASQKAMAQRMEKKGLVTLIELKPDGTEMVLTPDGEKVAKQPKPAGGPGAPLKS